MLQTKHSSMDRTVQQERLNAATHGLGMLLSLVGAAAVVWVSPRVETGLAVVCLVYVATLVVVYTVSTLSHSVHQPQAKHLLRIWDQGAIYLLIAGTHSPPIYAFAPPPWRWQLLAALWAGAGLGLISKVLIQHRVDHTFSTISYLLLGWLPAIPTIPYAPELFLSWIVAGGVGYTAGVAFLVRDHRAEHFHAIWHACVMIGSACHFYAIYALLLLPAAA